jgi:hypothetical protein
LEDASQLEKDNMVTTREYHVKRQEKVKIRIETVKNLKASLSWEDDKQGRILCQLNNYAVYILR